MKRSLFTGNTVKGLFAMTRSRNIDHLDFTAVYQVFRES